MSRVLDTPTVGPERAADHPRTDGTTPGAKAVPEAGVAAPPLPGHPPAEPEGSVPAPRRPRRGGWPRPLLPALLIVVLLPCTFLAGVELATPPVAGAPALVAAVDRDHHTVPIPADPSWRVSQAIVAAEDAGFYVNPGIDVTGLVRAAWGWVTGVDEGGSTITEQLAKVIYTGGRTGITDRVAQVALALKLNGHYTKPAILSMYLSAIYFGNGYYGVLAASEGYFGLLPAQLSWAQASLLAGLPQAPSLLDPLHNLALARERQSYVLDRLVATGALTRAAAAAAAAAPLGLR